MNVSYPRHWYSDRSEIALTQSSFMYMVDDYYLTVSTIVTIHYIIFVFQKLVEHEKQVAEV